MVGKTDIEAADALDAADVGDTRHVLRTLRLLRCQAGHACRAGQVDEQLPLQLPPPHGERLFGVLALREVKAPWLSYLFN